MIKNRSPPGVCWLTVRAVGGISKMRPTESGRGYMFSVRKCENLI